MYQKVKWNRNGWRRGARKIGISYREYADHRYAGDRWCPFHKSWHPEAAFVDIGPRSDGRKRWACKDALPSTPNGWAVAARTLGITLAEYSARREAGERWCSGHQTWHILEETPWHVFEEGVKAGKLDSNCVAAYEDYLGRVKSTT